MKISGPTNPNLQSLIKELKTCSITNKVNIWKRIATELEKSTRNRRKVNIHQIQKYSNDGETIIVPGKVLSMGNLTKQVKVAAWAFSEEAKTKIKDSITIEQLMKDNPKGSKVKIIC
ncbi:50S ribosomal protein L18e [Candidatus Woesearchaeota archaeon]|jgi:large subunit ribosomal protein L18e|nr:50S ribosomal protein L18e [Candidatus Woesearchaeota archaeon]MBT5215423.1 50S ribosomal protein L18e [Candidatus Woesearchaeota archaeon]